MWIAFLPSPCEQLSRTHREQSFTVTEVNVYVPSKSTFKMPTSWILSNLTRDVVRKITCQVDLLVVASQRWRMCDLYTETRRVLIGLKQGEVNGSDRPIYFTPLTSEACGEPHSLFNVSPGHASPAAPAFLLGIRGLCGGAVAKTVCLRHFDNLCFFLHDKECTRPVLHLVPGSGLWNRKELKRHWVILCLIPCVH